MDHVAEQLNKFTDIARRHDDEIEDLRVMTDFTHDLVMERENRDSNLKMVVKGWPKEAPNQSLGLYF